jgi:hypothetical protein
MCLASKRRRGGFARSLGAMNQVSQDCGPVPDRLRSALAAHHEIPSAWVRKTWERTLPDYVPLFSQLGDEVRRADVFALAQEIETEPQALNAFVAAMVWGHGMNGYGAWRTRRVLDENNPDAGKKLLAAAQAARRSGGPAGFDLLADDPLKYLGVAFATKYLFFCGQSESRPTPLVLDAVIQRWLGEHANLWLRLSWKKQDYRRYVECVGAWAAELGTTPEILEEAMFRDEVGSRSQFAPTPDRDLASVLEELDEMLAVALADRGAESLQNARAQVDALRQLVGNA